MPLACDNVVEFLRTLKDMRKIDDLVKHQMNRVLTTSSFESDQAAGCAEMRQTLADASTSRYAGINTCISTVGKQILDMQDNGADAKAIRNSQMSLKLMKRELISEDVLKAQSKKILEERCAKYA